MPFNDCRPLFLSFEGIDGSGKSTQIKLLCDWLRQTHELDVTQTREPGGTEIGAKIRNILLTGEADAMDGMEELMLFSADRHLHVRTLIKPALADGKWVVTDRFADTTRVFQQRRGIARDTIEAVTALAVDGCEPDLTLILDLAPEAGLRRSMEKAGQVVTPETRFESLGVQFQQESRAGFLALAEKNPNRYKVVDADGDVDIVQQRIRETVTAFVEAVAAELV